MALEPTANDRLHTLLDELVGELAGWPEAAPGADDGPPAGQGSASEPAVQVDAGVRSDAIAILRATAHADRLAVLELFDGSGGISPARAAGLLELPIGNVSYHVRQLSKFGLIENTHTRPVRGAVEHFYSLTVLGRTAVAMVRALELRLAEHARG